MRLIVSAVAALGLMACAPGSTSEVPVVTAAPDAPASAPPATPTTAVVNAQRFVASGREVLMEGATCVAQPGGDDLCTGDIAIRVAGLESLPPVRVREVLLRKESPLHVGEGPLAKPGATPTFALVDYDRDGLEDLAVAVDRLGGYGQLSYAIHLRRADGWALSPEFSALTEGRMGLPRREGDAWVASGKSGCCEHWDESYDVIDGKPILRETAVTTSNADGTTATKVLRGEAALARARGEG